METERLQGGVESDGSDLCRCLAVAMAQRDSQTVHRLLLTVGEEAEVQSQVNRGDNSVIRAINRILEVRDRAI
jgi:hypothetical protein